MQVGTNLSRSDILTESVNIKYNVSMRIEVKGERGVLVANLNNGNVTTNVSYKLSFLTTNYLSLFSFYVERKLITETCTPTQI